MSQIHLPGQSATNQLVRPTSSGLVYVRGDSAYELHRRVGRFTLTTDEASSHAHLHDAVMRMQEKMISGLAKRGYEYAGEDFEFRGPLDHIDISEDAHPDPGPDASPDPRDREAQAAWERAERSRIALKQGEMVHLVDYELVTAFRVKVVGALHRAA